MEFTNTTAQEVVDANAGADYLNGLSAFTVSIWVKSDVIATDNGFLVSGFLIDDDLFSCRYDVAGTSGGGTNVIKIGFRVAALPGGKIQYESASFVQTLDWQHLVFGYPDPSDQIFLYINGVLDTPTDQTTAVVGGALQDITSIIVGLGGKNDVWGP